MATPATHDHAPPDGQETVRQEKDGARHTPIEPLRAVPPRTLPPPVPLPAKRSQPQPARAAERRVGLFQKILLGDLTLWFVLSGVLVYEVFREHLLPEHALVAASVGLAVALAVAMGLKQVANRIVQLNRGASEISRGDLSKPLSLERIDWLGRDEVDELTTAISNMQANLRELVGHIQATSRSVADSADEMQESSANVSAQAESIDRSMAKINKGAEHQLQLVDLVAAHPVRPLGGERLGQVSAADLERAAVELHHAVRHLLQADRHRERHGQARQRSEQRVLGRELLAEHFVGQDC